MEKPFIIGITGGSASGKTLFLTSLLKSFSKEEVCLISQDNYYRDRELQPVDDKGVQNFDLPESIDQKQYAEDILAIKNGEVVTRKEYTFNNPDRVPETLTFRPAPIVIVEGIFVFHFKEVADLLDMKLFIEAKEHVKLKRRIIRDNEERGYDLEDVLYRYEKHVAPTYYKYIAPYKPEADVIIPNNTDFDRGLDVITSYLRSLLR